MNSSHHIYPIKKGDTLKKIAEETGLSIEGIKAYHNRYCELDQLIVGDNLPGLYKLFLPSNKDEIIKKQSGAVLHTKENSIISNLNFGEEIRYRTEQVVINKINDIITNHAETKREFIVKQAFSANKTFFKVEMVDNIIKFSPQYMEESLNLISEVDNIKCNSLVEINPVTGRINRIHNYNEILQNWKNYKKDFKKRFSLFNKSRESQAVEDFITGSEALLIPEKNLIKDLETKMFFDLFFSTHLVNSQELSEIAPRVFYSSFFDQIEVPMSFRQDIIKEDNELMKVRKVSSIAEESLPLKKIEKMYNERFKPMVGYKFSEFNYSYREHVTINKEQKLLEKSHVTIIEEVKNNIQLLIDYKLKRIQ